MARRARTNGPSEKPRAIWRGAISFGLVNVPVTLHRAVGSRRLEFHDLHDEDGGRVHRRALCSVDGAPLSREHIVKGFEVKRGHWVAVSNEELGALDAVASRTLPILRFVDPEEIDPIFYERTYWLLPHVGGERPYALLATAMAETRRAALARLTMRARQHLSVIRALPRDHGHVLALSTLGYADEVVPAGDLPALGREVPAERELALAERLIRSLSGEFEPERYHDEHRAKVLDYLRRKAEGTAPVLVAAPAPPLPQADLTSALEASLAEAGRHETAA
jgi:DNA end-binding protein Ku